MSNDFRIVREVIWGFTQHKVFKYLALNILYLIQIKFNFLKNQSILWRPNLLGNPPSWVLWIVFSTRQNINTNFLIKQAPEKRKLYFVHPIESNSVLDVQHLFCSIIPTENYVIISIVWPNKLKFSMHTGTLLIPMDFQSSSYLVTVRSHTETPACLSWKMWESIQ